MNEFTLPEKTKASPQKSRQPWAVEYHKNESTRQKSLRLSLWALVAILGFVVILARLLGGENVVSFFREMVEWLK